MHARFLAAVAALSLLATALPVHAQTQWLDRDARSVVRFDALQTGLDGDAAAFPTGVLVATARCPLGERAWFVGELPYATASEPTYYYPLPAYYAGDGSRDYHESTVGNPYLGVELAPRDGSLRYELGVRPCLVAQDASLARAAGFVSGVEREHAFLDRVATVRAAVDVHGATTARRRVGYDVRVAPVFQFATEAGPASFAVADASFIPYDGGTFLARRGGRSEFYVDYDANLRLEGPRARLAVGFASHARLSRNTSPWAHDALREVALDLEALHGAVRPGLLAVFPLDRADADPRRVSAGLTLTVDLSRPSASGGVWAARSTP